MTAATRVFELFKAGTHTDMHGRVLSFSAADVRGIALSFSPSVRPAPLCPGHPHDDRPELGQVQSLHTDEAGLRLFAQATVSSALVQAVREHSVTAVSAAFFAPGQENNPKPWTYYLKHVGFLGAHQKPGVKNLAPLSFGAPGGVVAFSAPEGPALNFAAVQFSAPSGCVVDAERLDIHMIACQHLRLCPGLGYVEAVRRATRKH